MKVYSEHKSGLPSLAIQNPNEASDCTQSDTLYSSQ